MYLVNSQNVCPLELWMTLQRFFGVLGFNFTQAIVLRSYRSNTLVNTWSLTKYNWQCVWSKHISWMSFLLNLLTNFLFRWTLNNGSYKQYGDWPTLAYAAMKGLRWNFQVWKELSLVILSLMMNIIYSTIYKTSGRK